MSRYTDEERISMYQSLLHDIQLCSVTMNEKRLRKLLDNINAWSYAHRIGNGELTEAEQQKIIDHAFSQLRVVNDT